MAILFVGSNFARNWFEFSISIDTITLQDLSASSILGEFTMRVREIPLFPYFMPLLKETWTLYEGKLS